MTIIYIVGTQRQIEHLHEVSRVLYIDAFKAQYPEAKTEIETDHTDRITGEVHDCEWQLAIDGITHHSDRFDDYIKHPNYPSTDKCLLIYDDAEEANDLKPAFYYKLSTRLANGADLGLTNYTLEEVKAQGFFSGDEK